MCALRLCGSACDGAAPATVRDVDQALAVAATIRTTACTCALSSHWDMHILTRACACHVIEVMGLHLSRSAGDADQALAVLITVDPTRARSASSLACGRRGMN